MDVLIANDQLEMAVLGCAMQDPQCALRVAAMAQDAFGLKQTQAVHRAIQRLAKRGQTVDMIGVSEQVRVDIENPQAVLMDMISKGFVTSAFETYFTQLMIYRRKRIVGTAAQNAIADIVSPGCDIDAVCGALEKAIRDDCSDRNVMTAEQAVMSFMQAMLGAQNGRCYTGLTKLDNLTGGLKGGKLVILGARPGVGKTALALQIARHVADGGQRVLFVSLEMDETQLMARIVAGLSGVDCQKLESGRISQQEAIDAAEWYGYAGRLPLMISTKATTPLQIRSLASELKYQDKGLGMIIIDYLQLMRTDVRGKSRYEEISQISRQLKLLAQDLGIPVMAMTQFNRDSERDGGSVPTMAQAKDSGSIEQDANLFLILHSVAKQPDQEKRPMEWQMYHGCNANGLQYQQLFVAKNRQGRTGMIDLAFNKPHMLFTVIE